MKYSRLVFLEKMSKPLSILFLTVFAVIIATAAMCAHGCAPLKGLSQEETNLLHFYAFYNQQFESYQMATQNPEILTEDQKQVLRVKRDLLEKLHPMILAYEIQVTSNDLKAAKTAILIFELIDQFGGNL